MKTTMTEQQFKLCVSRRIFLAAITDRRGNYWAAEVQQGGKSLWQSSKQWS